MPDPGATDPADLQVHACAWLGLSQLKQTRRVPPHPHCGGGDYNVWFREEQLANAQAREDDAVSQNSLCRWREHLHPYCQTANKARVEVVGVDLPNFVTFLRAWPEATLGKMAIFLYNEEGPLYSKQVLSRCLTKLSILKRGPKQWPIRLRGRTFNTLSLVSGTNPPLLAFFRCFDA
jgi:hypothetical protein